MVHGAFCKLSQTQSADIHVGNATMQPVAGTLYGRLAMMAIADMFFPHGLPGSLRRLLTSPAP